MPRAQLSSQALFAIAADIADREGFDAVTVSAVARQAGVRPASIYSHIRDRDALLDGLQQLALRELAARVGDAIAGRAGREALIGLVEAHRSYASERPGAWASLQRPASADTVGSPEAGRIASLMLAVIRDYRLPDEELVHAARFVGATVNGFLALTRAEAFEHRDPATELSWVAAIDAVDRALNTWPTEGDLP
ncbi:AcrR family transcriptional regulator [Rhodococcus sp. PvR044]|jgi:AcrR family transcriptional regulator|uniref:TetR/AcrR family transcriptional regulator n=1 Tax=unclassified Rhodococcus (in: high G+C Gram-positive bacteria) TaxID=192944 RepID=UPI000BC3E8A5|nr:MULTISPECIES: TetR/AcrR family transcriptional regulator [unclassified Rhodococcus (in: high G+C Gram-positive bacteria)]MBP1160532.1 AcrR family transcriptional regulator [Rhodococcus sp. PvR099]PTR36433.1 TetR family transcriptional regulator [Rhodococcus sp. OK611]SNX93920.1 transcriptional regulator, TetR family [Rhodococcus sp. OK270]